MILKTHYNGYFITINAALDERFMSSGFQPDMLGLTDIRGSNPLRSTIICK
jgi:hypothetical protein